MRRKNLCSSQARTRALVTIGRAKCTREVAKSAAVPYLLFMKKWMLALSMLIAVPLAAQAHKADGKVTLNDKTTVRLHHAYGFVHEAKEDDDPNVTVIFTDKPVPAEWDLHQFETSAPAGVTALVLRMGDEDPERVTLYHASGTFVLQSPKIGQIWQQFGEAIEGRVFLSSTTLEDGATTLSFNVKFELEVE